MSPRQLTKNLEIIEIWQVQYRGINAVEPPLRGHPQDREKCPINRGDLLYKDGVSVYYMYAGMEMSQSRGSTVFHKDDTTRFISI